MIAERAVCVTTTCAAGLARRVVMERHFRERAAFVALLGSLEFVNAVPPSPPPAGIRLSHPNYWSSFQTFLREIRRAIADNVASLMIVENDAMFDADIAESAPALVSTLEAAGVPAPCMVMFGGRHKVMPERHAGYVRCLDTTATHCFLLTRAGLELAAEILSDTDYLVRRMKPRTNEIDQTLASRMSADLITYGPETRWLAHQRVCPSTITGFNYTARPDHPGMITRPWVWKW